MNLELSRILRPAIVLLLSMLSGSAALANQAPTYPFEFKAIAVSPTEVRLSWNPSTDDRQVKSYHLSRDSRLIATTKETHYLDKDAEPGALHVYKLVASDGSLFSPAAVFRVSILTRDSVKNTNSKQNSVKNRDSIAETVPKGWQLTFDESFDGSGDLEVDSLGANWRFETMNDGLHRAGNTDIDASGNLVNNWASVEGKRWSAWYNGYNDSNAYRENGELVMGGFFSGEVDPTRPMDYVDNGVLTQYGNSKLYCAWIDTFSRKWVGPGDKHIMDPDSPGKLFKYGYFEASVNFSAMNTPGFRVSIWLMPASNDAEGQDLVADKAYDEDGNNGVEIDLFEYEWISEKHENHIQLALLGGAAGSSATNFDASTLGIDLHEGYHTVGFLWEAERIVWFLDGNKVKEVTDSSLIPDVYSYLIISREMNSGVKNPELESIDDADMLEEWPYIPRDPGLYAKNIWEYRDRINTDVAVVDYVRVWQP